MYIGVISREACFVVVKERISISDITNKFKY